MKTDSFIAGVALGAVAAIAISKKFFNAKLPFCSTSAGVDSPALQDAENAVDTLRGSVDILKKELNNHIESEQTYASQCEDLKDQVAKKDVEIENLKNVCDKQGCYSRKLEEELDAIKAQK